MPEIRVLGPVAAVVNGGPADLGGLRQRRLLAALAVDAGSVVSADRLVERVWGDGRLPSEPRAALRTYLSRLRQTLGRDGVVVSDGAGWRLDEKTIQIDARRFTALVNEADDPALDVHGRLHRLDEALALWHGDAFEEVAAEDWARSEADRLNELRVTAIERRYEAMLGAGMHTDALPGLAGEVDAHPLRDRLVGLHMLALYRTGRQAEATRVFQAHRDRLADELGLEPSRELVELDRRIVAGDPSLHLDERQVTGRALRGYRLGEQLGEGAFAVVYRGTQPSVGRDVAVKIVRAEFANRPDFVRRFEVEGHLVARLEHPFIVPLYDFWREPDRACLVFRYLRGGTLEARLTASGGLRSDEVARMVEQVGSALTAAHAAGVVHRDVKPANVFLDGEGNYYLGDFGIALEAAELTDPMAALSAGSPAYASPEQLRRETIGPAADVHGLGISVYEALTARLPFPDATTQAELLQRQLHDPIPPVGQLRSDVPPRVDEVLRHATAKDPADRYQSVDEFVTEFLDALTGGATPGPTRPGTVTTVSVAEARNPYKGLRAFTEADAGDFFGRERLTADLVEMLRRDGTAGRIAAVVGPSGIGKSSVVRSGLLPALRRGAVPGSDLWFVATMLPGSDPFQELAAALLRVADHVPENMMSELAADHRGIARVVKGVVPDDGDAEVLLVIDQFEELFTQVEDELLRRRFLDAIEHALTDARCPLRVVLTMRADFWDRPLRHGKFARLIAQSTVHVTALAPDELERAIVEPAHRTGCEFEPGLVSEIVADVTDQPGALPLLQYALTELWERQVSGLLTRDAYAEIGGVTGALAGRAEELYSDASAEERAATRHVFERLVTLGEGAEDTRRRALRSELGESEAIASVIDRFGASRLLSFDRDQATREPTVEVAHEALIRQWPRLRGWLEEDRDHLRVMRHVHSTAAEWDAAGRPDTELYRGGRLDAAEEWLASHPTEPTPVEREFVEHSVAARRSQQDKERRQNRRLRRLLTVVGVVALIALIAGAIAFAQQREAADQRDRAESEATAAAAASDRAEVARREADIRRLVAESANQVDVDRRLALLMALEAHGRDPSAETLGAIQRALVRSPQNWLGTLSAAEPYVAAQFLDENRLAAMSESGFDIWDVGAGAIERTVALPPDPVSLAVAADRRTMAIGHQDGGWEVLATDDFSEIESGEANDRVSAIALNDDGSRLAVGTADGTATIHHMPRASEPPLEIERGAEVQDLTFRPGEPLVAIGTGVFGTALIVDVDTGELGPELAIGPENLLGADVIAWHDRGLLVGNQEEVVIADPRSGAIVGELSSVNRLNGPGVADAASGSVALTGADGTVELLLPGARELMSIGRDRQVGGIEAVALDPAGRLVGIVGSNGVSLVTTDGTGALATATLPTDVVQVRLAEDGRTALASDPSSGPISVWDLDHTDAPVDVLDFGHFAQSGEGFVFVRRGPDGGLQTALWKDGSLTPLATDDAFQAVGLSPDERVVVVSTHGAELQVLDARSGRLITTLDAVEQEAPTLEALSRFAGDLEFTPDGELLVVAVTNGAVYRYDTETWQQVGERIPPEYGFQGIDFTSDGSTAATLHWENGMELRRGSDLALLRGPVPTINVSGLGGQNPDILAGDRYAVTGGFPGGATLWDLETLTPVGDPFPHVTDYRHPSLAADAKLLATTTGTEAVIWNVDVETWPDIACRAAGRNMTADEWPVFGPQYEGYHATCPQWPALG